MVLDRLATARSREHAYRVLARPDVFRVGAVGEPGSARGMKKGGSLREGLLRRWTVYRDVSDEPCDCLAYGRAR